MDLQNIKYWSALHCSLNALVNVPISGSVLDLRAVFRRLTIDDNVLWNGQLGIPRAWGHVHHQVIQRTPSHLWGKCTCICARKISRNIYIDYLIKDTCRAISISLPCTTNSILTTWNIMYCTCTRMFNRIAISIFLLLSSAYLSQ